MLDHTTKAYGYSLPKVKGTLLLLKGLAAFCMLGSVTASTTPTSGFSEQIEALTEKCAALEAKEMANAAEIEALRKFVGMTPPSSPPAPPLPPP